MAEEKTETQVKVTMIGGKNVGKTCFMLGMYAVMRRGIHNFFLHTTDIDDDSRLIQGWTSLTRRGNERKWPVPTNVALKRYEFAFKRGMGRNLMSFEWVDYRGGALFEERESAQDLIDQLVTSDCLFFCLDGGELREPVADRMLEVDHRMCISRAKILLEDLPHRVPIVVLVTKHDLCGNRPQSEVMEDIHRLFDAWLVPGEGWEVMICPVTLGSELAADRENGTVDPLNLHLPLIYAIFSLTVTRMVNQERQQKTLRASQQAMDNRIRDLGSNVLLELWNQKEIDNAREQRDEIVRRQRMHQSTIQGLRKDVALLGRELSRAVMYSDGERVIVG